MEIDIRPEVNILSVLRHLNYKPWFALAEFVDNSLGSYLASTLPLAGQQLKVAIEIFTEGEGRIVVTDNAAGIRLEDFPRAFRAAEVPPDRSGLSEFGMGMKSAASWFARSWTVRTSVIGESIERSVNFNLARITELKIDTLAVYEAWAHPDAHYTIIELEGLNHIPQTATVTKIKSHLASIYRTFLRDSTMELKYRSDRLDFQEVEALVAPPATGPSEPSVRWLKRIDFTLSGGKSVGGFAGVRAVGSTSQAGFALLRRGRLILGSHDEPYRPVEIFGRSNTYTYQRLYGELTLHGFEVSHTKDGFRWEEQEEEFLEKLGNAIRNEPLNLFAQASGYRAKSIVDMFAPIEEAASSVAEAVKKNFDVVYEAVVEAPDVEVAVPNEVEYAKPQQSIRRTIEIKLEQVTWIIEIEATLEVATSDWLRVGAVVDDIGEDNGPLSRVDVVISLAHPFSRKFLGAANENSELIIAFGSAFALALALGKLNGAKSYSILHHLNSLVRETFASNEFKEESKR